MDRILSNHPCECGCGEYTYISRWTKNYAGHVKGQPYRFRPGHQRRLLPKQDRVGPPCACGCGTLVTKRHPSVAAARGGEFPQFALGHHTRSRPTLRAYRRRNGKLIHIARAEQAIGKPLPPQAKVHHADGTKNPYGTLVICEDQAYHMLLHVRMRVKAAGGDPNTDRICYTCKAVKPIVEFSKNPKPIWYCKDCKNALLRVQRARKKAAA